MCLLLTPLYACALDFALQRRHTPSVQAHNFPIVRSRLLAPCPITIYLIYPDIYLYFDVYKVEESGKYVQFISYQSHSS
jgi:hypothetical protein